MKRTKARLVGVAGFKPVSILWKSIIPVLLFYSSCSIEYSLKRQYLLSLVRINIGSRLSIVPIECESPFFEYPLYPLSFK